VDLMNLGMTALDPVTGAGVANIPALWEDTLREYGKKETKRYMAPPPPPMAPPPEVQDATGANMMPPEQNGQGAMPPEMMPA
jgi:hypothetical protein